MTNREQRWLLNTNPGQDVVHTDPGEACNTDDAEGKEWVDPATARALVEHGAARYCEHCSADVGEHL